MYSNDLEACGMKCCYFLFHSEVNFLCVHCSQVSDSGLLGLLFSSLSCRLANQRANIDHEDSADCFEIDEPKEMEGMYV